MADHANWKDYYEKEAELKDYNPAADSVEIHRCRAVWSVFPRTRVESLLDAGCGNGFFCHWISGRTSLRRVTGLDIASGRIERARERYPHMEFQQGEVSALPFTDGEFDVVTCIEVLEHLTDPVPALRELMRVARQYVIVTVPDRQPLKMLLCPHCGKRFPEYGHIQSFDRARIEELARTAGGRVEHMSLYYAPRGGRWGVPFWLGGVIVRALQLLRPSPATFIAARIRPGGVPDETRP